MWNQKWQLKGLMGIIWLKQPTTGEKQIPVFQVGTHFLSKVFNFLSTQRTVELWTFCFNLLIEYIVHDNFKSFFLIIHKIR
jgi:hypothetical protein